MEFQIISTARLQLLLCTPEVLNHVFEEMNEDELMQFFGAKSAEGLAKEKMRQAKGRTTFNKSFAYFHLIKDDEVIGWCGYHTHYTDHDRAELGYVLYDEVHMGKGYMQEALEAVIAYGFKTIKLHRIEAMVGLNNGPSLALLNKFNFSKEGLLREHYLKNGKHEDSLVYSLLRSEYVT